MIRNQKQKTNTQQLVVGWLYPELMSTYGDRGNIIVLEKRCQWRNIEVKTLPITFSTTAKQLENCDLIFGGGAQDRQQSLAIADLLKKGPTLQNMFNNKIPGLFVCGSPQLLGHYFIDGEGNKLTGLEIFDMWTEYPKDAKTRCIGNLVAELVGDYSLQSTDYRKTIVGFENHGGRTHLGKNAKPFAKVIKGYGNNGEDGTEGAVYQNVIATYSHGPFLPKNPHIADWLIKTALDVKYGQDLQLEPLDDALEWQAHDFMLRRLGVKPL